ncbi:MAG: hydroxyacid dehydrogenase [Candidatus Promineifilaceae bacterium]
MKILIASSIHSQAVERLKAEHDVICAFGASEETLQSLIIDREVLILRSGVQITADVLAAAPHLKLILRAGSGVDNIDVDYVRQVGIQLVRIPGPGAKAVAELSFALMLALSRNVLKADQLWRNGHWVKYEMTGYLLTGKVLGIVGAGNIGSRAGQLGVAWGMTVLGCVESPNSEKGEHLWKQGIYLTSFNEVLSSSDFVSIHVPLKDSTRYLIDAEAIGRMKPDAILVNLARGGVVDEAALCQALSNGHLRGAALDVHEVEGEGKISPLAKFDNVILTPHMGAGTYDSQQEIGEIVVETISAFTSRPAEGSLESDRVVVHV